MFRSLGLVLLLAASVHSAPACKNPAFHTLTTDLGDFLVNQTQLVNDLADYIQDKFAAGLEDKIVLFYLNLDNAANLLEFAIDAALKVDALEDRLKHLGIEKVIAKHQELAKKQKGGGRILSDLVIQYKWILNKIENSTAAGVNKTCDPAVVFEALITILDKDSTNLNRALEQLSSSFERLANPVKALEKDLNISKLIANTIVTLAARLVQYGRPPSTLTYAEIVALRDVQFYTMYSHTVIDGMEKKDKADMAQFRHSLKTIAQYVEIISGEPL